MSHFTKEPNQVTSFPDCCGASILSHFGEDETLHKFHKMDKKVFTEWLDKQTDFQRKRMGMSLLTCILNDAQMTRFGDLFTERGWVFTPPAYHPKHRSRLYLGYLQLFKDPGTEDRAGFDKDDDYGSGDRDIMVLKDGYQYEYEQVE